MSDLLYKKLLKHWDQVTELPPQQVGPFTPLYKAITKRLKIMPWPVLVLMGSLVVIGLYFLLGSTITFLVSILQRGF